MSKILVRGVIPEDHQKIQDLCRRVYPDTPPWSLEQLESHLHFFPAGQLVAVDADHLDKVFGYSASLIIDWDDYEDWQSWKEFTDRGLFSNHNTKTGKTLYGAEVMVDPTIQSQGIGGKIYRAREHLAKSLGLLRIRAGARLRNYGKVASKMSADDYVLKVVRGEMRDPTLTFQLRNGFKVIDVVSDYLFSDPESLGFAALIEWLNPERATVDVYQRQKKSPFFSDFVPTSRKKASAKG